MAEREAAVSLTSRARGQHRVRTGSDCSGIAYRDGKSIPAKAWKLTISWPPKMTIITTRFPCLNHLIEIIIMGIFMSLLPVHEI